MDVASVNPKKSTGPKRTPQQRDADLAMIEYQYVRGVRVAGLVKLIAETRPYRLSRQQIENDLNKIDEMWKAQAIAERSKAKRLELAGLARQEAELWEAWEKSKAAKTKDVIEQTADGAGGAATKKRRESETGFGDASYMRLILEVRAQRRAILGLDEAKKLEVTGEDGSPLIPHDISTALELAYGRNIAAETVAAFTAQSGATGNLRN